MKTFNVHLRDGKVVQVQAQRYRREGDQYVFESDGDDEVQFFDETVVSGIVLATPYQPTSFFVAGEQSGRSILPGADAGG
jgi:hypothetical protein